jgi:hypothetical protein
VVDDGVIYVCIALYIPFLDFLSNTVYVLLLRARNIEHLFVRIKKLLKVVVLKSFFSVFLFYTASVSQHDLYSTLVLLSFYIIVFDGYVKTTKERSKITFN